MKRIVVLPFLILTGCFGGITNKPFEPGTGTIRGFLTGEISMNDAWVRVVGYPALDALPDATGAFSIVDVPNGNYEITASTGMGRAVPPQPIDVYNARELDLTLDSEPALVVRGRVAFEDRVTDMVEIRVFVEGLPVETVATPEGFFSFPHLPAGCHDIGVGHPGFFRSLLDTCGGSGESVDDVNHRLVRDEPDRLRAICGPCRGDDQCESGLCVENGAERVCTRSCGGDLPCPTGFRCGDVHRDVGQVCLPVESTSCTALSDLVHDRRCDTSDQCGLAGRDDAVCTMQHTCSVTCNETNPCPDGLTCHAGDGRAGFCL